MTATPTSADGLVRLDDPGSMFRAAAERLGSGYRVEGDSGVEVERIPDDAVA